MRNSPKIIFFDVDGTLIDFEAGTASAKTMEALQKLQASGIKICMATGRVTTCIPQFPGFVFDAIMAFNGALCFTPEEIIWGCPVAREDLARLLDNAGRMGKAVSIASQDDLAANGVDADLAEYYAIAGLELTASPNFERIMEQNIYQAIVSCRPAEYEALMAGVQGSKIEAWWDRAVDIVPVKAGKGAGTEKVLEYFHLDKAQAMAFGDGGNDIELLQAVGMGIAMGNASEALKSVAREVCGSAAEDGIYHYCVEKGLILP